MYESFPYIEPCCSHIQLGTLMRVTEKRGVTNFFTHSDVPLIDIITWIATYAPMGKATYVTADHPGSMMKILDYCLSRSYYNAVSQRFEHLINSLTVIITDKDKEIFRPYAVRYGDRMKVVVSDKVTFDCLTLTHGERGIILTGSGLSQLTDSTGLRLFTLQCGANLYREVHMVLNSLIHTGTSISATVPEDAPVPEDTTVPDASPSGSTIVPEDTTVPDASPSGSTTIPDASPSGSTPKPRKSRKSSKSPNPRLPHPLTPNP